MYQASEQLIALNKAQLEAAARFAGVALHGAERMLDLQMEAAKTAFAEGIENAKALASVKGVQDLAALKDTVAQPSLEKATTYAKGMYDAALQTQSEFSRLFEEQIADFNKQFVALLDGAVKNAPAGSDIAITAVKSGIAAVNAAYDNMAKMAKQFTDTAQSNFEFAASQAANEAKKSRKAA